MWTLLDYLDYTTFNERTRKSKEKENDVAWSDKVCSLADRARRAPPHLPGILVFDDILGHIV